MEREGESRVSNKKRPDEEVEERCTRGVNLWNKGKLEGTFLDSTKCTA